MKKLTMEKMIKEIFGANINNYKSKLNSLDAINSIDLLLSNNSYYYIQKDLKDLLDLSKLHLYGYLDIQKLLDIGSIVFILSTERILNIYIKRYFKDIHIFIYENKKMCKYEISSIFDIYNYSLNDSYIQESIKLLLYFMYETSGYKDNNYPHKFTLDKNSTLYSNLPIDNLKEKGDLLYNNYIVKNNLKKEDLITNDNSIIYKSCEYDAYYNSQTRNIIEFDNELSDKLKLKYGNSLQKMNISKSTIGLGNVFTIINNDKSYICNVDVDVKNDYYCFGTSVIFLHMFNIYGTSVISVPIPIDKMDTSDTAASELLHDYVKNTVYFNKDREYIYNELIKFLYDSVRVILHIVDINNRKIYYKVKEDNTNNKKYVRKNRKEEVYDDSSTTNIIKRKSNVLKFDKSNFNIIYKSHPKKEHEHVGSKKEHFRRGHFRHYWVGPRNDPSKRKRIEVWIEPTVVKGRCKSKKIITSMPL